MIWYREAHFWSRASVPASVFECWHWRKTITDKGYGQYRFGGGIIMAHRFAYELAFGPIPEGLEVDHLCRSRSCVSPLHLEAVTSQENNSRARQTTGPHCTKGHQLSSRTMHILQNGVTLCRTCVREKMSGVPARLKAS